MRDSPGPHAMPTERARQVRRHRQREWCASHHPLPPEHTPTHDDGHREDDHEDHDKHAHAGIVPHTYQIERQGESGLKPLELRVPLHPASTPRGPTAPVV